MVKAEDILAVCSPHPCRAGPRWRIVIIYNKQGDQEVIEPLWPPAHEPRLRGELGTITWHCRADMLDQMDDGTRLIPLIRIRLAAPRQEL